MLSYNEMIECEQKYSYENKQMSIAKYKAFIEYIKKVIKLTFEDNEEQIASYLKETNFKSFLLDWNVGNSNIHYDGFSITRSMDDLLNVNSLRAHDYLYDPILQLESDIVDDGKIIQFFDKEYIHFIKLFAPHYGLTDLHNVNKSIDKNDSLVWQIANKFNEVCYDRFKTHYESFGMKDFDDFIESKFSLSFTNERRLELDGKVYEYYNSYCETLNELTKKFNESVKDFK